MTTVLENHGVMRSEVVGPVSTITIDIPPLNILSAEFREVFVPHLEQLKSRSDIRVIIITGEGEKAFCAGADLKEEGELTEATTQQFVAESMRNYDVLGEMPQVVIAAVNGYAFGGGLELALAADIRILSERAVFGAAGVKVGLVASPTRLTRLIGLARASDLVLTGRSVGSFEAQRMGLGSEVVPPRQLLQRCLDIAHEIVDQQNLSNNNEVDERCQENTRGANHEKIN